MPTNAELLGACKNALLAAVKAGEEPRAAVERLYVEYEGVMTRESMLAGYEYARATFAKRAELAQEEATKRAKRFKAAQADDVACLEMLMELSRRLPGIIERLKAEPTSG